MKKINVAIVGVGSFAKALVEGVSYYTKNPNDSTGLMHPVIGGYKVRDINFVCAFDVDARKVGQPLHRAISAGGNVTKKITNPISYKAQVYRGPTLDGVVEAMKGNFVQESSEAIADVVALLKKTKTDIVINLVPSGGDQATYFYANAALQAGCHFINCIPTPLATLPAWRKKFEDANLVLIGDDIKSQLGATMLNRLLLELLQMRGIKVTKSEQINRGGNADHLNLIHRSAHKEKSKSETLKVFLGESTVKPVVKFVYTGQPSGHKVVDLIIEGEIFGNTPIRIQSFIEDEISINGAGTLVDAIRVTKTLDEKKATKKAKEACAFLMKTPPISMSDRKAYMVFQKLISGKPARN